MSAGVSFEEVAPGAAITPLVKRPTNVQLFRFSAVTWNAHRIHYDTAYAHTEGYPDVLVQSHLHGCFLVQAVLDWAGPRARLRRFSWQNRRFALPGDVLTCSGKVTATEVHDTVGLVTCELEERNQDGELCAPGWATIELPRATVMGNDHGA
ncbi:MAG: acyl dehydratase [Streptosporangiales bacterium]|nr:acyl dehydratase [Streptosporangiales bacterium]